jgi:hypothetical protein
VEHMRDAVTQIHYTYEGQFVVGELSGHGRHAYVDPSYGEQIYTGE